MGARHGASDPEIDRTWLAIAVLGSVVSWFRGQSVPREAMLKLNRVVDYGLLILVHMLREEGRGKAISSAKEIAHANHLSLPMVSKILKGLQRSHLVVSARGVRGGYALDEAAADLTLAELIRVLDGPIRLTDCAPGRATSEAECDLHELCSLRGTMLRVNELIRAAFDGVTLRDIAHPPAPAPRGIPLPVRKGAERVALEPSGST